MLDEWAACGIERPADIRALYADRFWFGCEADDPMTSLAFNTAVNPFGAELQVMLGSDIAHWDLPDVSEVLEEAYEMVENGWIDKRLASGTSCSPTRPASTPAPIRAFFEGTVVEQAVAGCSEGSDVLDLIVRGGRVVDGTGEPARTADVACARRAGGGRRGRGRGCRPESSTPPGMVVCPGFVDIHTHYDAQLLWDTTASPSVQHGVTTVIGGNCGFSIAPLGPGDAEYIQSMMAVVEGMPRAGARSAVDRGRGGASPSTSTGWMWDCRSTPASWSATRPSAGW